MFNDIQSYRPLDGALQITERVNRRDDGGIRVTLIPWHWITKVIAD